MFNILKRLAAGTFVLGVLTVAVFGGKISKQSTPQDPPNPFVEPEPASKTVVDPYVPTSHPQPKPAQGEWKRYTIDGYYRWVWFSPNDKRVTKAAVSEQATSSGRSSRKCSRRGGCN